MKRLKTAETCVRSLVMRGHDHVINKDSCDNNLSTALFPSFTPEKIHEDN